MVLYDTTCIWINILGEIFAYTEVASINVYTTTLLKNNKYWQFMYL